MKQILEDTIIELYGENIIIPFYFDLKPELCAKYCRLLAEDLFGITYLPKDSWNYIHYTQIKTKFRKNKKLSTVVNSNNINPGEVILCKYPKSQYLNKLDINGNKALGTHLCIYLGENYQNQNLFAHQFDGNQYIFSLEEFEYFKLNPQVLMKK